MGNLLSLNSVENETKRGVYTSEEIERQHNTWIETWKRLLEQKKSIKKFLQDLTDLNNLNIVLTGAGSSAFIGDVVLSTWHEYFTRPTQAIPTTDLVTHFKQRILIPNPLLLISFARSGESPESMAAIEIANQKCSEVYHFIITCNPDGELAKLDNRENTYVFVMPDKAEDKSLAMTNSFTSMALAATLIPKLNQADQEKLGNQIDVLANYGKKIISDYIDLLYNVSQIDFDRIIFLGSGPLWGIAKESQLKVQELTNGKVVGKFDSFLGFRHGPKVLINDKTLLVYLLSNNNKTQQYERDLIQQISQHDIDLKTLAVSETEIDISGLDFTLSFNDSFELEEDMWSIICALPAQIIGFYKSLALSFNPDMPSPEGTISRVVEGVKIYNPNLQSIQD